MSTNPNKPNANIRAITPRHVINMLSSEDNSSTSSSSSDSSSTSSDSSSSSSPSSLFSSSDDDSSPLKPTIRPSSNHTANAQRCGADVFDLFSDDDPVDSVNSNPPPNHSTGATTTLAPVGPIKVKTSLYTRNKQLPIPPPTSQPQNPPQIASTQTSTNSSIPPNLPQHPKPKPQNQWADVMYESDEDSGFKHAQGQHQQHSTISKPKPHPFSGQPFKPKSTLQNEMASHNDSDIDFVEIRRNNNNQNSSTKPFNPYKQTSQHSNQTHLEQFEQMMIDAAIAASLGQSPVPPPHMQQNDIMDAIPARENPFKKPRKEREPPGLAVTQAQKVQAKALEERIWLSEQENAGFFIPKIDHVDENDEKKRRLQSLLQSKAGGGGAGAGAGTNGQNHSATSSTATTPSSAPSTATSDKSTPNTTADKGTDKSIKAVTVKPSMLGGMTMGLARPPPPSFGSSMPPPSIPFTAPPTTLSSDVINKTTKNQKAIADGQVFAQSITPLKMSEVPNSAHVTLPRLQTPLTLNEILGFKMELKNYVLGWTLINPPPVSFRPSHLDVYDEGPIFPRKAARNDQMTTQPQDTPPLAPTPATVHTLPALPGPSQPNTQASSLNSKSTPLKANSSLNRSKSLKPDDLVNLSSSNYTNTFLNTSEVEIFATQLRERKKALLEQEFAIENEAKIWKIQTSLTGDSISNFNNKKNDQYTTIPRPMLRRLSYFKDAAEYVDYYLPLLFLDLHASLCNDYDEKVQTDQNILKHAQAPGAPTHGRASNLSQRYGHARCIIASLPKDKQERLMQIRKATVNPHVSNSVLYESANILNKWSTVGVQQGDSGSSVANAQNQNQHQNAANNNDPVTCNCLLSSHSSFHVSWFDLDKQMLRLQRFQYTSKVNFNQHRENNKIQTVFTQEPTSTNPSIRDTDDGSGTANRDRERDRNYDRNVSSSSSPFSSDSKIKPVVSDLQIRRIPVNVNLETEQTLCLVAPEVNLYVFPHRPHKEHQTFAQPRQHVHSYRKQQPQPQIQAVQGQNEWVLINGTKCYFEEHPGTIPLIHVLGTINRSQQKRESFEKGEKGEKSDLLIHFSFDSRVDIHSQQGQGGMNMNGGGGGGMNASSTAWGAINRDTLVSSTKTTARELYHPNFIPTTIHQLIAQFQVCSDNFPLWMQQLGRFNSFIQGQKSSQPPPRHGSHHHHHGSHHHQQGNVNNISDKFGFTGQFSCPNNQPFPLRLRVYPLNSLVTVAREYIALRQLAAYPIVYPLLNPVMHPLIQLEVQPNSSKNSAGQTVTKMISFEAQTTEAINEAWAKLPRDLRGHFQQNLNPGQLRAVKQCLYEGSLKKLLPAITLLQGPPGTGKTKTILALLNIIYIVKYNQYCEQVIVSVYQSLLLNAFYALFQRSEASIIGGHISEAVDSMTGLETQQFRSLRDLIGLPPQCRPLKSLSKNTPTVLKPKMLVCAPSNGGVDEIVQRLMDVGMLDGMLHRFSPALIRLGNSESMRDVVKNISLSAQVEGYYSMKYSEIARQIDHMHRRQNDVESHLSSIQIEITSRCTQAIYDYLQVPQGDNLSVKSAIEKASTIRQRILSYQPQPNQPTYKLLGAGNGFFSSPHNGGLQLASKLLSLILEKAKVEYELKIFLTLRSIYNQHDLQTTSLQSSMVTHGINGNHTNLNTSHINDHKNSQYTVVTSSSSAPAEKSLLQTTNSAFYLPQTRDLIDILISRSEIVFSTSSASHELVRDETTLTQYQPSSQLTSSSMGVSSGAGNKQHDVFRSPLIDTSQPSSSAHPTLSSLPSTDLSHLEWDALLVDEACQCSEAGVVVALSRKVKHCVLVGDPRQLPSTVFLSRPNHEYNTLTHGDNKQAVQLGLAHALAKANATHSLPSQTSSSSLFSAMIGGHSKNNHQPGNGANLPNAGFDKSTSKSIYLIPDGLLRVYERSLFERLQQGGHPVHMLTEQYRMHPLIVYFSSSQFYLNQITTSYSVMKRIRFGEPFYVAPGFGALKFFNITPFSQICQVNQNHPQINSINLNNLPKLPSIPHFISSRFGPQHYNYNEALAICQFVCLLITKFGVEGSSIGVITYYQAQKALLEYILPLFVKHFVHNHQTYQPQPYPLINSANSQLNINPTQTLTNHPLITLANNTNPNETQQISAIDSKLAKVNDSIANNWSLVSPSGSNNYTNSYKGQFPPVHSQLYKAILSNIVASKLAYDVELGQIRAQQSASLHIDVDNDLIRAPSQNLTDPPPSGSTTNAAASPQSNLTAQPTQYLGNPTSGPNAQSSLTFHQNLLELSRSPPFTETSHVVVPDPHAMKVNRSTYSIDFPNLTFVQEIQKSQKTAKPVEKAAASTVANTTAPNVHKLQLIYNFNNARPIAFNFTPYIPQSNNYNDENRGNSVNNNNNNANTNAKGSTGKNEAPSRSTKKGLFVSPDNSPLPPQCLFNINPHDYHHVCSCPVCSFILSQVARIDMGTVDGFQGRENRIIMVSCVRTSQVRKGGGALAPMQAPPPPEAIYDNDSASSSDDEDPSDDSTSSTAQSNKQDQNKNQNQNQNQGFDQGNAQSNAQIELQRGSLGFLKDGRRVNVSLTRAKQALYVFGDSHTLARILLPSAPSRPNNDLIQFYHKNHHRMNHWDAFLQLTHIMGCFEHFSISTLKEQANIASKAFIDLSTGIALEETTQFTQQQQQQQQQPTNTNNNSRPNNPNLNQYSQSQQSRPNPHNNSNNNQNNGPPGGNMNRNRPPMMNNMHNNNNNNNNPNQMNNYMGNPNQPGPNRPNGPPNHYNQPPRNQFR